MSVLTTGYEHIVLDEKGMARITGTTMKVIELVAEAIAYGWSPEELHFQHSYLSLGQIHSALAYYWDHAEQLNQQLEQDFKEAEKIRQSSGSSPLVARLKSKGLI